MIKMTREEYDNLVSNGEYPCPDCGSYVTHPFPGCYCPSKIFGIGTKHINRYHHICEIVKELIKKKGSKELNGL